MGLIKPPASLKVGGTFGIYCFYKDFIPLSRFRRVFPHHLFSFPRRWDLADFSYKMYVSTGCRSRRNLLKLGHLCQFCRQIKQIDYLCSKSVANYTGKEPSWKNCLPTLSTLVRAHSTNRKRMSQQDFSYIPDQTPYISTAKSADEQSSFSENTRAKLRGYLEKCSFSLRIPWYVKSLLHCKLPDHIRIIIAPTP